jgi:hypothetical protein
MPPLDLALRLGMIGRASNVGHVLGIEPIREVAQYVARPIIRQQTWSVPDMSLITARRRQRVIGGAKVFHGRGGIVPLLAD